MSGIEPVAVSAEGVQREFMPGSMRNKRVFASDAEYAASRSHARAAVAAHANKPVAHLHVTGHNAFRNLLHVEDVIESKLYIYSADTGNIYD